MDEEEFEPGMHIEIGEFAISRFDDGTFWLNNRDSGEGGQFSEAALADALGRFFYEFF